MLVIDEDQGHSGATAEGRLGFQHLMAEVGLDHVGLVLGLEMSRLARADEDWHRLLKLCAIFRTLLGDQDGLYDPTDPNDRLLLGIKGIMSAAELHVLRGRMQEGKRHKARRGELFMLPPVGYVKLPTGEFAIDPDEQVQDVVRLGPAAARGTDHAQAAARSVKRAGRTRPGLIRAMWLQECLRHPRKRIGVSAGRALGTSACARMSRRPKRRTLRRKLRPCGPQ